MYARRPSSFTHLLRECAQAVCTGKTQTIWQHRFALPHLSAARRVLRQQSGPSIDAWRSPPGRKGQACNSCAASRALYIRRVQQASDANCIIEDYCGKWKKSIIFLRLKTTHDLQLQCKRPSLHSTTYAGSSSYAPAAASVTCTKGNLERLMRL